MNRNYDGSILTHDDSWGKLELKHDVIASQSINFRHQSVWAEITEDDGVALFDSIALKEAVAGNEPYAKAFMAMLEHIASSLNMGIGALLFIIDKERQE